MFLLVIKYYYWLLGYAMKKLTAKYVRDNFGEFMDSSIQNEVVITKNGRPSVVAMSIDKYITLTGDENMAA